VKSVYATGSSSTAELKEAGVFDNATMVMTFQKGEIEKLLCLYKMQPVSYTQSLTYQFF
jgi:hypothetical protein